MKVGGRREIIVPPVDGYGITGQGSVTPNEELVFVVDVLAASAPSPSPSASTSPSASGSASVSPSATQ
jgi:peptidylprolyl isomerase